MIKAASPSTGGFFINDVEINRIAKRKKDRIGSNWVHSSYDTPGKVPNGDLNEKMKPFLQTTIQSGNGGGDFNYDSKSRNNEGKINKSLKIALKKKNLCMAKNK